MAKTLKTNQLEFCVGVAAHDKKCFEKGTEKGDKWNNDLWEVWDTNNDGIIQDSELNSALESMDLDGDGITTHLEMTAYLTRN